MNEIVLKGKKNGMAALLIQLVLYVAAFVGLVIGGTKMDAGEMGIYPVLFGICVAYVCIAWIGFLGLKILKPQEALVLTLFGKYIGTIKGDGFYYVNPFCGAVNPAARTELNQSGDVKKVPIATATNNGMVAVSAVDGNGKKLY